MTDTIKRYRQCHSLRGYAEVCKTYCLDLLWYSPRNALSYPDFQGVSAEQSLESTSFRCLSPSVSRIKTVLGGKKLLFRGSWAPQAYPDTPAEALSKRHVPSFPFLRSLLTRLTQQRAPPSHSSPRGRRQTRRGPSAGGLALPTAGPHQAGGGGGQRRRGEAARPAGGLTCGGEAVPACAHQSRLRAGVATPTAGGR